MNIGIYIGELQAKEVGGGHTFQTAVISSLLKNKANKHKFFVYYFCRENLFEDENNVKFINTYVIQKRFFHKKRLKNIDINDLLLEHKIELLYSINPFMNFTPQVPFIHTIWDIAHKVYPYFPEVSTKGFTYEDRESVLSKNLPRASYVLIGTETGKNQLVHYYNLTKDKIKVTSMPTPDYVYSTKDDDSILKKYNLDKYLLYPAQFWAHKNHIRLLKAMKTLKNEGFKMVFAGSDAGNMEYIKEKIREFNLGNTVVITDFVSKENLISLYKNAYALCYASIMGPDNIPPLEAMALKCPVVTSRYDGAEEQLGDCALYFNPYDENEIVQKVLSLENDELKQDLIKKGEILAKSRHINNYIEKVYDIFNDFKEIRETWGF